MNRRKFILTLSDLPAVLYLFLKTYRMRRKYFLNTISIENTPLYSLPASPSWNLIDKLQEKEDELLKLLFG